jgi:hypothetical protein
VIGAGNDMEKVKLGQKVRDKISGFSGIVTSYAKHLNGCDRAWISPPVDKDGKLMDGSWFDVVQLEAIEEAALVTQQTNEKLGGPVSKIK